MEQTEQQIKKKIKDTSVFDIDEVKEEVKKQTADTMKKIQAPLDIAITAVLGIIAFTFFAQKNILFGLLFAIPCFAGIAKLIIMLVKWKKIKKNKAEETKKEKMMEKTPEISEDNLQKDQNQ